MDREMKSPKFQLTPEKPMEKYSDDAATTNVRKWGRARHCCSVVAHQLLIYKDIVSSEMVLRQILSAYEPRILGKGAGHDQDPL